MQVEIVVHPTFIAGIVRGTFSMADAKAGLDRIADACRQHGCSKVLLDGRMLESGFGVADRFVAAEYLAAVLPQGTHVASLSHAPIHQESKIFENTANNRGAFMLTTQSAVEAANFLGIDPADIG
ncbi:MAG: hypothetical protein JNK75_02090 [Betaproteobacteria bacterium]|nr:hypothetical protein [Betaproteobacteria bacterium]